MTVIGKMSGSVWRSAASWDSREQSPSLPSLQHFRLTLLHVGRVFCFPIIVVELEERREGHLRAHPNDAVPFHANVLE